eukprot:Mycagemm_TRINITY_DN9968_c0_g1::TRINITY_DN9968_c0_g1_i1::g.3484::m.3484 type:complete len:149 gc:universal TRINITY_DN9968_c0_g1_i1:495-49(-)
MEQAQLHQRTPGGLARTSASFRHSCEVRWTPIRHRRRLTTTVKVEGRSNGLIPRVSISRAAGRRCKRHFRRRHLKCGNRSNSLCPSLVNTPESLTCTRVVTRVRRIPRAWPSVLTADRQRISSNARDASSRIVVKNHLQLLEGDQCYD